jgi:hypothetical protein
MSLVRALRGVPKPSVPEAMIQRAEAGYYHDYLSPLALPEMALYNELRALANAPTRKGTESRAAILAIMEEVIDGHFDASTAESDAWARSPEGKRAFLALTKGKKP